MNAARLNTLYFSLVLLVTLVVAIWILFFADEHDPTHGNGHGHHAAEMADPKGPQGGRLLTQGGFALELTIFEKGLPPEFHVYAYVEGKPVPPGRVDLTIELTRLDGQVDSFSFSPQDDYLRGQGVVTEPHSFDVKVHAVYQGQRFEWQYDNYEGRTHINRAMANEAGIKTRVAEAATLTETLAITGQVQMDPDRVAHVRARFPGVIKSVKHTLGDVVRNGEVLASIQSNESLQSYKVTTPIDGVIVHRDIQVGEATSIEPLYIIADLSRVWLEIDLFTQDLKRVQTGQQVLIETLTGDQFSGTIDWISPLASQTSQSVRARVVLTNREGLLRPGQFVRGEITIATHTVDLAVPLSAIQGFRDFNVVFARIHDTYEVRMLELGRRDRQWVEVLSGLKAGTEYVSENSYLIKADIEKSGASHDH